MNVGAPDVLREEIASHRAGRGGAARVLTMEAPG